MWKDKCCQEKKIREVLAGKVVRLLKHSGCNGQTCEAGSKEVAKQLIKVVAHQVYMNEKPAHILKVVRQGSHCIKVTCAIPAGAPLPMFEE